MYGFLARDMEDWIKPYVKSKVVWDLGAADLEYTMKVLEMGATSVVAVDRAYKRDYDIDPSKVPPNIKLEACYFKDLHPSSIEVAFLSWPQNMRMPGLLELLSVAETIIYLGSNVNGDSCGFPALYDYLRTRHIAVHIPHRANTLAIYTSAIVDREPILEELAGLNPFGYYRLE
jgi:hypothetical protein